MFARRIPESHDPDKNKALADSGKKEGGGLFSRFAKAQEEADEEDATGLLANNSDFRRKREENPFVFLEFVAGGRELGKVTIELRADIVPIASENFRQLCTGERGKSRKTGVKLHYKGSTLHRVVADKYLVGGDMNRGDGTHSECSFGTPTGKFPDENFLLRHTGPGVVGMYNLGPNSNGSHFYITTAETSWMDEKYVVVGAVTNQASLDTLFLLERLGTDWGQTKRVIYISNSGQNER